MFPFAALIPLLGDIIKRLFPDPAEQTAKLAALEQASAQSDKAFTDFIAATQPQGQVIAGVPWFVNLIGALQNMLVASVRPIITFFAAYQVYLHPDKFTSPMYLVPIMFWFVGRSVEKVMGQEGFSVQDFAQPQPQPLQPVPRPVFTPLQPSAPPASAQPGSIWTDRGGSER